MKLTVLYSVFILSIISVLSQHLELFRQSRYSSGFFSGNEYETKILCVSDNSNDAFIFNDRLDSDTVRDKKYHEIFDVENNFHSNRNECQIEMDYSSCLSEWKNDSNWKVVSSLEFPMGPVYDKRWERFQEYDKIIESNTHYSFVTTENNHANCVFNSSQGQNAVVVSIRGSANAHFLLCKSEYYHNESCYWLIIGGWDNTITGIRKCEGGIPEEKPASGSNCSILRASKTRYSALDALEWRTFIITWNAQTKTISLYDSGELVVSYTDDENNSFNITKVLYGNPNPLTPMLFRFHNYHYILSKNPGAMLISPTLTTNYANGFCIEMLIGLCSTCELVVKLIDGDSEKKTSKKFSSRPDDQALKHGLLSWQHVRFNVTDIYEYELPFIVHIITKTTGTLDANQYHWAIGNIRECASENSLRQLLYMDKIRLQGPSDVSQLDPTCQKFSYNKSEASTIETSSTVSEAPRGVYSCLDSRIGVHCRISCSQYFGENCPRVSVCNQFGCYCSQGSHGSNCDDECVGETYGYGCKSSCQNCVGYYTSNYYYQKNRICSPFDGKCNNGCQESATFYVPPYCNVEISPSVPTIDYVNETTVRVSLSEVEEHKGHEDIDVLVTFEIESASNKEKGDSLIASEEYKNNTIKNHFAVIANLTAGEKYFVRTVFTIEHSENRHKILESPKESFRTACHWDKTFEVERNTTSLLLKRIYEEKDYVCPDDWYDVEVKMAYDNEFEPMPPVHIVDTFPMMIENLKPHMPYNVCVSNFDVGFYNCQIISTLEAEPSIVQTLQAKEINAHDLLIEWSPPRESNGILQGYQLMISVMYYEGCQRLNFNTSENLLTSRIFPNISTGHFMSYRVYNLSSYVTYEVNVRAYNSKLGVDKSIIVTTDELKVPTETFDDLKLENDTIFWKYPKDCSTVTGQIYSGRLFITGLTEHVQNYSIKRDIYGFSYRLSTGDTVGAEKYQVRLHVLHRLYGIQNETAYSELIFVTRPRSPPQVEDLTIVEVDQGEKKLTLRWRPPKPPHNGEISYYAIKFSMNSADTSHTVRVYPNETCQLWNDSICKTVDQPFGERETVEVTAFNKEVETPGKTTHIEYRHHETAPDAPKITSIKEIDNGVVELRWNHPSITGGPLKKFVITEETLMTLIGSISILPDSFNTIEYPISQYQLQYSTHLYLLPSTRYNISIKAVTNLKQSVVSNVIIVTKCTSAFEVEPRVTKNDDGLTFDVFIPRVINGTYASSIAIVVKGIPDCDNPARPNFVIQRNLALEYHEMTWMAGTFPAYMIANRSFKLGDNMTYSRITNCLLRADTDYMVILLIVNPSILVALQSDMITWKSQLIRTEQYYKSHAFWVVPLVGLIIIAGAGGIFYYVRRRSKKDTSEPLPMNSVNTPIEDNSHVLTPVDTTDNTDLISVNSVFP